MFVIILSALAFGAAVFLIIMKITLKKQLEKASPVNAAPETHLPVIPEDSNLSPREKEICELLLTGLSTKEIAYSLKISYSGANFHAQNLFRKLGVKNRTELLLKFGKPKG